jgi:hypothetical protein
MSLGTTTELVEVSQFTPKVNVPINGQVFGNADLSSVLQGLANRTRYLLNALRTQFYYAHRVLHFTATWIPCAAPPTNYWYYPISLGQTPTVGDVVEVNVNLCVSSTIGAGIGALVYLGNAVTPPSPGMLPFGSDSFPLVGNQAAGGNTAGGGRFDLPVTVAGLDTVFIALAFTTPTSTTPNFPGTVANASISIKFASQ